MLVKNKAHPVKEIELGVQEIILKANEERRLQSSSPRQVADSLYELGGISLKWSRYPERRFVQVDIHNKISCQIGREILKPMAESGFKTQYVGIVAPDLGSKLYVSFIGFINKIDFVTLPNPTKNLDEYMGEVNWFPKALRRS